MSEKYRPDVRGWATLGMFALVGYVLTLIAFVPALQDNELFKTVATLLVGTGGFGLVCAFLWGGSKATVAAIDTVNDMAKGAPSTGKPLVVEAPAKVEVTPGDDAPPWERLP